MSGIGFDQAVAALKAAAEPTRLRLIALLATSELNVKDLTHVLGQSQPRISRHLKLLAEAGLIERYREGSWVYLRLADGAGRGGLATALLGLVDASDTVLRRDRDRAAALRAERAAAAQAYFARHASDWDHIRSHHVDEADVEAAMRGMLGEAGRSLGTLVDLGTGTGRILELFAAVCDRAIGIDVNHTMLANARTRLDGLGLGHMQLRQGDIYNLSLQDASANTVVMHQVLHFLTEPARALREAGRILAPGGRLLLVDFAPHELEELRDAFAHQRLGFSTDQIQSWLGEAGLALDEERALAPAAAAQGTSLTVKLWSCRRIGVPGTDEARARPDDRRRQLEQVR